MRISGRRSLPFSREAVWRGLLDPELLCRALPGCHRLAPEGEETFVGSLSLQVGSVQGEYRGTIELFDLAPPAAYNFRFSGQGTAGAARGESTVHLEEEGLGTLLTYELVATVEGRVAGQGERLLKSAGRVMARQGLEGLERELGARADTAREERRGEEAREAPPLPSPGSLLASFAVDLLAETLPRRWRPWVALGGLLLLALFVGLVLLLRS